MNPTLSLGRIAGIKVGLNWSWLIVFALIAWSLAAAVFPAQDPGLSKGAYAAMGVVAAVLFFVSLLLHEFGHAVVARREGMEIDGITLWLFGGVARFKGSFPSAGAEFRIAIAGPFVTLLIGTVCVLLAGFTSFSSSVDGVAAWLGYINFLLLGFNLLPALPLDGGRVLRAALWRARGDFDRATLLAAGISRALAFLMIGLGVVLFITHGAFSGAWLAFIGWFLLMSAGAEGRSVMTREALAGLSVRDLMVGSPVTARPDETLGRFMDETAGTSRHTAYPVVEDGRAVGLLPFSCIVRTPRDRWDERRVADCMLPRAEIPVLTEGEGAFEALTDLSEHEAQHGLVVEGDRLVGFLALSDIARALAARAQPRPSTRR